MVLKYQVSKAPARLEDMIVRIWEAESDVPGAHVFELVIPERDSFGVPTPGAGHQVKYTVTANGLDKVVHIVRLIGAISGEEIHKYDAEPTTDVITLFDPIQFKIGDGGDLTPAAGTTTYTNPILENFDPTKYLIMRNNYGFLFDGTHYNSNSPAGAWDLIDPDQFNDEEEFTILMQPKAVTTVVNDSVVAKLFKDFLDVAANTDYDATHLRKLIRFSGTCNYNFTVAVQPPAKYIHVFTHLGATNGVGTINFQNGNLLWGATEKSSIDIPRYCTAGFTWDNVLGKWNCVFMVQSSFVNGGITPIGTVLGTGRYHVGDVPPGDYAVSIVHNLNITGDYNVFLSIMTTSDSYVRDNKMGMAWWHDTTGQKKDRFNVTLQEISGEVQNLDIVWLLIKA